MWFQNDAYIHKLYDIVNEYNNTYHRIIKMKPVDVKSSTYIDFDVEIIKIVYLKLGTMQEYQNIKTFFQKVTLQISPKKFFWLIKKLKWLYHGHMLLVILTVKRFFERIMEKNWKRSIKQNRVEKVTKRKVDKLYVK